MELSAKSRPAESACDLVSRLVERHSRDADRPTEFDLLGLRWDLLPGVFAPIYTASTELFSEWMPYPAGGRFLEVGCGAGVTAVMAALRGCDRVDALDIVADAVRNTTMNAARHLVADRVQARHSDLFEALNPQNRFDVIYWNSAVVLAPAEFSYTSDVERAIFDRGYRAHRRYLSEGAARLTVGGRLLLGFNTLGDRDRLDELAHEAGLRITERRSLTHHAGDIPVTFQLLDIVPAR